jgi:hypothetical protein
MMKRIVTYKIFEAESGRELLTPEQIDWLNKCSGGSESWTLNPETGLVDVMSNFDCSSQNLTDFKGVRFGQIVGDFPFNCSHNQLSSLDGSPQSVGGDFFCNNNQLSSLDGAPQSVGKGFYCSDNQLRTLEGAPQSVGGNFLCNNNQLSTLEGAPQSVGKGFYCYDNKLVSLKGAPESVGGDFYCNNNQITSLKGSPIRVKNNFFCNKNQLTSLEGLPQRIGGYFGSHDNPVSEYVLSEIYSEMKGGESYQETLQKLWDEFPMEDQALLYRPEFKWVSDDDARKLKAFANYKRIEGMI